MEFVVEFVAGDIVIDQLFPVELRGVDLLQKGGRFEVDACRTVKVGQLDATLVEAPRVVHLFGQIDVAVEVVDRGSEPGKKFSLPDPFQSVLARAGIDTRYPRGETPRHEPLRPLETTGSPAHQRGLSADDGATASHGMVAAEVFRWADS